MKQHKKNERNEGQRPADLGLSLSGYTAFSGDPRLSRPLSAITENTKAPAGKKRSRLISTVTAVLITATVVALPLIFLWNYLGEGQDTPTPPTYDEPPVYTPPQSEHTQTPTTPTPPS